MTASTKMLISKTGGDQPQRERDGVYGGNWRIECDRKSEYGKSESETNGKRQEIWVGNRWNERRLKKGNMKLKRDGITGYQCRYEGRVTDWKGRNQSRKGTQNCMSENSKWRRVGSTATAKWERKGKYLVDCKTADEWGTVWKRSKWDTERTCESGLRERIAVWGDRMKGWWVME